MVENKAKSLKDIFLDFAKPDSDGFTEDISLEDLIKIDPRFATGNGGSWCRSDGFLKDYNIVRKLEKNRIVSVKLEGKNNVMKDRRIKEEIRRKIVAKPCAILGVNAGVQCDHRNGKYNDKTVANVETQDLKDFQPLSRAANTAKRTHCKKCKLDGSRFDARVLGYNVGWTKGDEKTATCVGCYWNGPIEFNAEISSGYQKNK